MSCHLSTQSLKDEAHRLGFDLAGVCPAVVPPGISRFREWLAAGYAGEMNYFADRADAYENPASVLDGVRSILMLGMAYQTEEPQRPEMGQGRVSRYAWGRDYHDLIRSRLNELAAFHRRMAHPGGGTWRGRFGSAPRTRVRPVGWLGLDRKEHASAQPSLRKLVLSGGLTDQPGARLRRTVAGRPLRYLPGVSRCMPHGGIDRTLQVGRQALH